MNPSRFGFVEFADRAGAEAAKAMGGAQLAEMTLKVKHSNNPIVKEAMKNVWGTEDAARRRALRAARREWEDRKRRRRRRRREEEEKSRRGRETDARRGDERRTRGDAAGGDAGSETNAKVTSGGASLETEDGDGEDIPARFTKY